MIPNIEYIRPQSLGEALELLGKNGKKNEDEFRVKILAGGTDIIPGFQQESSRFSDIRKLVDINGIPELKKIQSRDKHLAIGAASTFSSLEHNRNIITHFPLLSKAASTIGSLQIRHRATVAGNFVNNAPCADSVSPLLVYDAWVKIESLHGSRQIPLQEFLIKPYQTKIQSDEIITEVLLPWLPEGYQGDFYKLGRRRAVAISRITLSVLGKVQNNTLKDIRIASGAVTPIGMRFFKLEGAVKGEKLSSQLYQDMAIEMGKHISAITGIRWSTPYKLPVVQQTVYQLLEKIFPFA